MPDTLERWLRVIALRARSLFRRGAVEQELERELRSHIDLQIEEYRAAGMTADAARQMALREFGGVARFQDDVRDTWRTNVIDDLHRASGWR